MEAQVYKKRTLIRQAERGPVRDVGARRTPAMDGPSYPTRIRIDPHPPVFVIDETWTKTK